MTPELQQVLAGAALLTLTVALPLLPAIAVYKLFPDSKITAKGPLAGLSVRAGGAVAFYLVVFAVLIPMYYSTKEFVSGITHPAWTIVGKVELVDPNGKPIADADALRDAVITYANPTTWGITTKTLLVHVPEMDNRIPELVIEVPGLGQATVDTGTEERDWSRREIRIAKPIQIQVSRGAGEPYAPAGSLVPVEALDAAPGGAPKGP
jgi:hypothetical protein